MKRPEWLRTAMIRVGGLWPVDPETRTLANAILQRLEFDRLGAPDVTRIDAGIMMLWSRDGREADVSCIGPRCVQVAYWSDEEQYITRYGGRPAGQPFHEVWSACRDAVARVYRLEPTPMEEMLWP